MLIILINKNSRHKACYTWVSLFQETQTHTTQKWCVSQGWVGGFKFIFLWEAVITGAVELEPRCNQVLVTHSLSVTPIFYRPVSFYVLIRRCMKLRIIKMLWMRTGECLCWLCNRIQTNEGFIPALMLCCFGQLSGRSFHCQVFVPRSFSSTEGLRQLSEQLNGLVSQVLLFIHLSH